MPSTFECPHCKSRYSRWVASVWDAPSETETETYQCKHCMNLFEIEHHLPESDDPDAHNEWVSAMSETDFFDNIYGRGRR